MQYAILSDIHSNLEAFKAVLKKCEDEKIKNFLFLGDIIGYGPNPVECVNLLQDIKCLAIVKGNHDAIIGDGRSSMDFNVNARASIEFTKSKLKNSQKKWIESFPLTANVEDFVIVHACLYVPDCWFYLFNDSIALSLTFNAMIKENKKLCFIGHSHLPMVFYKKNEMPSLVLPEVIPNDFTIINNGSIGQPRDGNSKACFLIYDSETKKIKIERVDYDIHKTVKKMNECGLPPSLGQRLFKGV